MPSWRKLAPSLNSPALKKYGVLRPALVTKLPNLSTSRANANARKSWRKSLMFVSYPRVQLTENEYSAALGPLRCRTDCSFRGSRGVESGRVNSAAFAGKTNCDAHHFAQRQRHPVRRAPGIRALVDPRRTLGRRLPPRGPRQCRRHPQGAAFAASLHVVVLRGAAQGIRRGRHVREASGDLHVRVRHLRIRRRGTLSAGRFCQRVGRQRVPAVGVGGAASAGIEVPVSGRIPPASAQARRHGARGGAVRRLEHCPPADRPQELAEQSEELGLFARRARMAVAIVGRYRSRRCIPEGRSATRSSTPSGRTGGTRMPRMSVGESTTSSRPRASLRRRTRFRFTRTDAFPITRRLSSTMTLRCIKRG